MKFELSKTNWQCTWLHSVLVLVLLSAQPVLPCLSDCLQLRFSLADYLGNDLCVHHSSKSLLRWTFLQYWWHLCMYMHVITVIREWTINYLCTNCCMVCKLEHDSSVFASMFVTVWGMLSESKVLLWDRRPSSQIRASFELVAVSLPELAFKILTAEIVLAYFYPFLVVVLPSCIPWSLVIDLKKILETGWQLQAVSFITIHDK